MKLFGGDLSRIKKIFNRIGEFFKNMPMKSRIILGAALVALAMAVTLAAVIINSVKPPEPVQDKPVSAEQESQVVPLGDEIDIEDRAHKADFFTVLIVGTDKEGWNTDTIMLAAFDVAAGKLNVLSIPRDTMVNVKRKNKKINAAFSSGGKGNIEELKDEVRSVTGIMADKYVLVDLNGFIEMIDAIGGVTVDVPVNMVYKDPAQDLTINIPKGVRTLDGYDAMGFMRFRATYVEGDIGRIKVQQTFVKALVDKMLKPSTLTKIPKLVDIMMDNVKTDFTNGNLVWLAREALKMDPATDIETFLLPGEGGYHNRVSYYFLYENQVLEMVNAYFNPYVTPIKKVNIIDPRGEVEKTVVPENPIEELPPEPIPEELENEASPVTEPEIEAEAENEADAEGTAGNEEIPQEGETEPETGNEGAYAPVPPEEWGTPEEENSGDTVPLPGDPAQEAEVIPDVPAEPEPEPDPVVPQPIEPTPAPDEPVQDDGAQIPEDFYIN